MPRLVIGTAGTAVGPGPQAFQVQAHYAPLENEPHRIADIRPPLDPRLKLFASASVGRDSVGRLTMGDRRP